jgi:PAS domain S-box-containing protein
MSSEGRGDLFDLVHESIFVRGLDGRIRSWNAASAQLYGHASQSAVGRDAHNLLATRHARPLPEIEAALAATGRWDGELLRTDASGAERLIDARWSLRRDAAGRPLEIIEIGRDVTDARAAEEALKRSDHRYRNIFQAMSVAFWELDFFPVGDMLRELRATGVKDFAAHFAAHPEFVRAMMRATRIVDVNDQVAAMLGRGDRAELLADLEAYWPQSSTPVYAASVLAAVTGKPNYSTETKVRAMDGREIDALFTACFPPDTMNKGTLLVGVIDISDRVRAQAVLAQVQAEFAHAARISMLGELTASIAHEVNQPLAAIAASAAAGQRWLNRDQPDLEEVKTLVARISRDAARAAEIIGRVRDMAMRRAPEPHLLSINGPIEEALQFLRHEIQAQGVTLALDLSPGLPSVLADRTQLQQVVVNLAINAVQAMGGGEGARTLSIRSALSAAGEPQVVVADSGPGIAAENLGRLFDSFFTTKEGGMGMGLPICRSIVESHGGRIEAANGEAGGARFTVTLPTGAAD